MPMISSVFKRYTPNMPTEDFWKDVKELVQWLPLERELRVWG